MGTSLRKRTLDNSSTMQVFFFIKVTCIGVITLRQFSADLDKRWITHLPFILGPHHSWIYFGFLFKSECDL